MEGKTHKFECEDYRGELVIFTEKKWKQKSIQHPELRRESFLKHVKKALESPEEVWQDYSDPDNKACYYYRYSIHAYIKVVIWLTSKPCHVVSAFEVNIIKEKQYPMLRQIK